MKKILLYIMITAFMLLVLCACGSNKKSETDSDTYNIVCVSYPEYDWTKQICKKADNVNINLLMDEGVDIHSYQPGTADIVMIKDADMLIFTGGPSEQWLKDIISENDNQVIIDLMNMPGFSIKQEEMSEGMEEESEKSEEPENDEHIWLSVKNAVRFTEYISNQLQVADEQNAAVYEKGAQHYIQELEELDMKYERAVNESEIRTVLFADRFPFRYLMDDYGIEYYAAFPGCSSETDASFNTIIFLSKKADELNLKNVIVIEGSDRKVAETLIKNTSEDTGITVMDSMQQVNLNNIDKNYSYLSVMDKNLESLKKALQIKE